MHAEESTRGGRQGRGDRTRAALIVAATTVFDEVGFNDATISAIARTAGVAHGSFYTHFDSKEAIFGEVIRVIDDEGLRDPSRTSKSASLTERIDRTNKRFFDMYRRHARTLASYEELAARDQAIADLRRATRRDYIEPTVRALSQWQADGVIDRDVDVEAVAHSLGSMVERVAHMQCVFDEGCGQDRMLEAMSYIWTAALGIQRGAADEREP